MNTNKLKAKIIENGFTVGEFIKNLGIHRSTFYRKLNDNSFTIGEVNHMVKILGLTNEEAIEIFFNHNVA